MALHREKQDNGIVVLTIDLENRPVNVLNQSLMEPFRAAVEQLAAEDDFTGVILTSAKNDFIAGADLDMLYAAKDATEVMTMIESFKAILRQLETLGKPVVAAINGTALGGGYEVCLACHYRIAINHPKTKIGLPEVTLGLLPGGGGTQRLPRLIGIQAALPILLEGKEFKPDQALAEGLIHELAEDRADLMTKAERWILANPEFHQPWDDAEFRWPGGNPRSAEMAQLWAIAPSMLRQKTHDNYPAACNILACVSEGSIMDFDTACRIESRYFVNCTLSKESKNMIQAFWYQLNSIAKGTSRPAGFPRSSVRKLGILGAGMMGAGIAYVSAYAGIDVVLKDLTRANAEKGKAYSSGILDKRVTQGKMSREAADVILARIVATDSVADLAGCDLVIEAVFEDRELKAAVTRETEAVIADSTVFASNTSTLPITGLAERSSRPRNFIGLHFFSPVDKMSLVEIIVGKATAPETIARSFDYVQQIKKTPIVVNDSRGFYTSRVFSTYVMEGVALLAEGQNARAVESAGVAAGMPVGPLAVTDEVSLDLVNHIIEQTKKDFALEGRTYVPNPGEKVIRMMVEQLKRMGRKSGHGFYEYPEKAKKHLWSELSQHFPESDLHYPQAEMIKRLIFVQAIESVKCLDEGVLNHVADANIGSIFGWGFSPFKGGTLQYINDCGLTEFVAEARRLAAAYGERFAPPDSLVQRAMRGEQY